MAELERDLRAPLADLIRTLLERQDQLEHRVVELESVIERHRQPRHENLYGSHALYALDEPRGAIE